MLTLPTYEELINHKLRRYGVGPFYIWHQMYKCKEQFCLGLPDPRTRPNRHWDGVAVHIHRSYSSLWRNTRRALRYTGLDLAPIGS